MEAEIEVNRQALLGVVAALVAMAGSGTLPRRLHRAALRLLRPAEWAARRLVIALARSLVPPPPRPRKPKPRAGSSFVYDRHTTGIFVPWSLRGKLRRAGRPDGNDPDAGHPATGNPDASFPDTGNPVANHPDAGNPDAKNPVAKHPGRRLSLALVDPPRRRRRSPVVLPRIWVPGVTRRAPAPVPRLLTPHDPLDAGRLVARIAAVKAALDDLPGHALRYARRREAQRRALAAPVPRPVARGQRRPLWPLRYRLPGGSAKATREVREILLEAHRLALLALVDTS